MGLLVLRLDFYRLSRGLANLPSLAPLLLYMPYKAFTDLVEAISRAIRGDIPKKK